MFKLVTLFLIISLYLFSSPVFAQTYFFQDEFDTERTQNTLDPKWTYYPNTITNFPTIKEGGGILKLNQQGNTNQFPLVVSKNPGLPNGDFSAEFKFQYTKVTFWGTGIALSADAPTNGNFNSLLTISVWQDKSIGPNMRVDFGGQSVKTIPLNTTPHTLKVDRTGQNYLLYLDNTLVYTSPNTPIQVKYIWLGNPSFQNPPIPEWTTFNVDYVRVLDLAPKKTPLILIPGIGGSELKVAEDTIWSKDDGKGDTFNHAYAKGEKVWVNEEKAIEPGNDDYFDILRLKPDGQTSEANLELTNNLYPGSYQPLIDFFTSNGYTLNTDLFIFPYDWRKDLSLTKDLLDQKINSVLTQTSSGKVDLLAHSMGGLVASNYISDPQKATKVRKLIKLGTPNLGSVEFLKALRHGTCLTKSGIPQQPFCLGITPSETQDILRNTPGAYQLSPSQNYFSFYNGSSDTLPTPFRDERDIDNNSVTGSLNYSQAKQLLTNLGHNTPLFTPAESFHILDNNLQNTNSVEVKNIVGSGLPTLGQIIEKYSFDFAGLKIPKTDELLINGDDTVPLLSASLNQTQNVFYTKQNHSGLVSNGPALNLVKNILGNDPALPTGISTTPIKLNGKQFSVHSPVNLHIYDQNNNHTGPLLSGDFEVNIPGSTYETLGDTKFIFLPDNGIYTIKFESLASGSFDFKIKNYTGDINDKTYFYKDIPITQNSLGQTTYNTTSPNPPTITLDNKQFTAFSTLVGSDNSDLTPPEIKVIFNTTIKKFDLLGLDPLPTQTKNISTNKSLISDSAGNTTPIDYDITNQNSKIKLKNFSDNLFEVNMAQNPKSKKIISLIQTIWLDGKQVLLAKYDPIKNKTTINKFAAGKTTTEIKSGIVLLYLKTNKNILEATY